MKTEIQIFKNDVFGEIRTMANERGDALFVAKDVLAALGYKNASKALTDHVEEGDVTKRYPIVDSLGRRQMVNVINESGLYSLLLSSKLEQEAGFQALGDERGAARNPSDGRDDAAFFAFCI